MKISMQQMRGAGKKKRKDDQQEHYWRWEREDAKRQESNREKL